MAKESETIAITVRLDKAMHKRARLVIAELGTTFKAFFEGAIQKAEAEIAEAKAKEADK